MRRVSVTLVELQGAAPPLTRRFFTQRGASRWTRLFTRMAWTQMRWLYERVE